MANEKLKIITPDEAEDHLVRNGIIWSILIPIIGVIWAIRLFARERVGGGFAVLATAILVVLVYFYAFGTFDKPLSSIGLNVHECARNGLGQTFCGQLNLTNTGRKLNGSNRNLSRLRKRPNENRRKPNRKRAKKKRRRRRTNAANLNPRWPLRRQSFRENPKAHAADLARDEYESDRAQLQQLGIR